MNGHCVRSFKNVIQSKGKDLIENCCTAGVVSLWVSTLANMTVAKVLVCAPSSHLDNAPKQLFSLIQNLIQGSYFF